MNWHHKTVFLTGASSGIGEGLALALAKNGAVLGLVARREELLRELAEKCERAGGVARAYPADVTDPSAVEEAFHPRVLDHRHSYRKCRHRRQ